MTKRCAKCGDLKPLDRFGASRERKDGKQPYCNDCRAAYRAINREALRAKDRQYYANNKARSKAYTVSYRSKNADAVKAREKKYRQSNKHKRKQYLAANRQTLWEKERARRGNGSEYGLRQRLRVRLYHALRGGSKVGSAVKDLGCSAADARRHIERQWSPDMSWDTYGPDGWVIDHIVPLAAFDLADPEQFKLAVHYTNLRPLAWVENSAKGDALLPEDAPLGPVAAAERRRQLYTNDTPPTNEEKNK